jgi:hypothetical protein
MVPTGTRGQKVRAAHPGIKIAGGWFPEHPARGLPRNRHLTPCLGRGKLTFMDVRAAECSADFEGAGPRPMATAA